MGEVIFMCMRASSVELPTPAHSLLCSLWKFERNNDPRRQASCVHRLSDILFVSLIAVVCGANNVVQVAHFAEIHLEWCRSHLGPEFHCPHQNTFYNILRMMDPDELHDLFVNWMSGTASTLKGVVAVDGKTIRGSKTLEKKASHIVSAFSTSCRLVLGQLAIDQKSNEITAVPELLKKLDIAGCLITLDAMGTQEHIACTILDRHADYLFVAKDNQIKTKEAIAEAIRNLPEGYRVEGPAFHEEEWVHTNGRDEKRTAVVCNNPELLPAYFPKKWPSVAGFAAITVTIREKGCESSHTTYMFFSRRDMTARDILAAKRDHWKIEANLHWRLDVIFREDSCHLSKDNSAENFNVIRHMAFNLLTTTPELQKIRGMENRRWVCHGSDKHRDAVVHTAFLLPVLENGGA